MHRNHHIAAILFTIAAMLVAFGAPAGHKPVCCKGYMYWDIFDRHGAGHQWRKVKDPIVMRQVPITPSLWNYAEAAQRMLLVMHAKAQQQAGSSDVKVRSWDSVCWGYGEPEPQKPSWPVQP